MSKLTNMIGVGTTLGGLLSNNFRKSRFAKPGQYAEWAKHIPSHYNNYGVQRDNLGLVICPVAKVLRDKWNNPNETLLGVSRRSESFNIPGQTLQTTDNRRYGVGPLSRMPVGNINPTTFTLNFVADEMGLYYQYWMAWMDGIVRSNGRSTSSMGTPNRYGTHFYEVEYFNNYAVDITLLELDPRYDKIVETKLINAYPIGIQEHTINWGNTGFVTFNVEFAYDAFDVKLDKLGGGKLPPRQNPRRSSTVANLIKAGNAIQLLSSMKSSGGLRGAAGIIGVGTAALANFGTIRR